MEFLIAFQVQEDENIDGDPTYSPTGDLSQLSNSGTEDPTTSSTYMIATTIQFPRPTTHTIAPSMTTTHRPRATCTLINNIRNGTPPVYTLTDDSGDESTARAPRPRRSTRRVCYL